MNPTDIRALGTVDTIGGKGVVRIEDRFDTEIDDLWSALTDPARLSRWLGDFDGDLRLGGAFRARFHASEWEGRGRVAVCEPPTRLMVVTTSADEPGEQQIEATLRADGDHTILVIEQRGMPPAHLAGYGAGTQIHVEDLAAHLAGEPRCDAMARFKQLMPLYS